MQQGIRRLMALAAVFAVAFGAVYLIRNGPEGFARLVPGGKGNGGEDFRPESYTLADRAPLNLGDVELLARLDAEYIKLTDAVVPSVVSIDTTALRERRLFDGYGRMRFQSVPTQGQGSGVIVSHEGHVVTNYHVVADQQKIQVTLPMVNGKPGKSFPATLIGEDRLLDIAVLKIDGDADTKFQPLKLGDSSQVRPGQNVFAIGNPFGLGETITRGIISAVERSLSDTQRDLFQTDAAINPGNSGGPLVNLQGEIIGINSAIFTPDRDKPGFQGVGFSIPSNDVKDTLHSILERGRPVRGYLGVRMLEGGVVIAVGPDSPAEKAGLKENDVILTFDDKEIRSTTQLINLVQRTRIGQVVPMRVWRSGSEVTLQATITESQPETMQMPQVAPGRTRDTGESLAAIGLDVRDLMPQERLRGFSGVVATRVRPEGLAGNSIRPGDLIVGVNESRISNATEFYLYLSASAAVQATTVHLFRNGEHSTASLPVLPRKEEEGPADIDPAPPAPAPEAAPVPER
ncbi:trypsin-like peptidase domain-containing protein [Luteolibacter flavescens]|uniref:Trypsin-like peptidase domain-containing protein n=1 Tax=Luteolibacter flavescens TaxID=1859460 RepID=A0ABT3FL30_9BACT|nr:trypsin-like peptidase domain-containing protein [Luteolibacter flavescens]MCW1883956.1 trypsin-like peptidase domain-containing protein [Luteolibacter flavescens]